jgi:hypothetical protein
MLGNVGSSMFGIRCVKPLAPTVPIDKTQISYSANSAGMSGFAEE